jgi:hypothetical protein
LLLLLLLLFTIGVFTIVIYCCGRDIDDVGRGDALLFRCRRVCRFGQWSTVVFYACVLIFRLISVLLI